MIWLDSHIPLGIWIEFHFPQSSTTNKSYWIVRTLPYTFLTDSSKINIGPTIYVSKSAPGLILQMDFSFFNAESIRGFTSTFVGICSANLYPFGFLSRIKLPPIDTLKFIVTAISNQYKKSGFIRMDQYGSLERSSEFMKTCHNMNIIFQTTGIDASSLNDKNQS